MSDEEKVVLDQTPAEEVNETKEEMKDVLPDPNAPIITIKKLLEAGAHFGHQTRRWNPKMKPYIYTARNGIYIVNLEKTVEKINEAYVALKKIVEDGGKVIFVGTKKQAQDIVKEEALRSGSFYVTSRWIGGTLTNFRTIQKSIKHLKEYEDMETDGSLNLRPKKEVAQILKRKEKLDKDLGGIKDIRKLPQAIFVIDPRIELNAVNEARKLHIPVFGVVDTNSDPDLVDYVIPGNDDATKAIKLFVGVFADAVVEGKGGQPVIAYTKDEGEEATMNDVIANVDKVEEAKQLARKAAANQRRQQNQRRQFSGQRKPYQGKKTEIKAEEVKAEETPVEEVKAEEAKSEEVVAKKPRAPRKPRAKKEETPAEEVKAEEPKAE